MADRTAEILAALASEEALEVVVALLERPDGTSVSELVSVTPYNQPKISRLIGVLDRVGLITRTSGARPIALSHEVPLRRLLDEAMGLAVEVLAGESSAATARQQRVRKSRLRDAKQPRG